MDACVAWASSAPSSSFISWRRRREKYDQLSLVVPFWECFDESCVWLNTGHGDKLMNRINGYLIGRADRLSTQHTHTFPAEWTFQSKKLATQWLTYSIGKKKKEKEYSMSGCCLFNFCFSPRVAFLNCINCKFFWVVLSRNVCLPYYSRVSEIFICTVSRCWMQRSREKERGSPEMFKERERLSPYMAVLFSLCVWTRFDFSPLAFFFLFIFFSQCNSLDSNKGITTHTGAHIGHVDLVFLWGHTHTHAHAGCSRSKR